MLLLEDQHRPQPYRLRTRATNVDTNSLRLLQHLVPSWGVPRNKRALALAAQVLDLVGVLLGEVLEAVVEVVARLGGVLYEVEALNFVNDGAEEDGAGWVTLYTQHC